jgi:chromatin modification-related protein VID21
MPPGQQAANGTGSAPQQRNGTPTSANATSPAMVGSSHTLGHPQAGLPNQNRPSPSVVQSMPHGSGSGSINGIPVSAPMHGGQPQGMPSGMNGVMPMSLKGMPQQPVPNMPNMSQEQMRLYMENQRIQQQQRAQLMHQQQQQARGQGSNQTSQQNQGSSSSPHTANGNINLSAAIQNNPALFAAWQQQMSGMNGMNGMNGNAGASASPRMGQAQPAQGAQPQTLSNGVIPTITSLSHQLQQKNPTMPPEQIRDMATRDLQRYQARLNQIQQQSAVTNAMNGSPQNQQMYAQMLRNQQMQQAQQRAISQLQNGQNGQNGQGPSRSATPQTQRSGSAQTNGQGNQQSPQQTHALPNGGQ